ALAVIIFVFAFYTVNVKAYLENRALMSALTVASEGKMNDSLSEFKRAISYDSIGTREAREQLAQTETQIVGRNDVPDDAKQAFAKTTIDEFKKQIVQSPTDTRYHLFLAIVYNSVGDVENARASIEKAIEYSPKKQEIYLQLAEIYYREGNT